MKYKKGFIFGLSIFGICLSACDKVENDINEVPPLPLPEVFVDLENDFDIHTDVQNNYLNDEYNNISKYGNGASENSKPRSYRINWNYDNCDDTDFTKVKITLFEVGHAETSREYTFDKSVKSFEVTNLKTGMCYELNFSAIYDNGMTKFYQSGRFCTKEENVRFIDVDGLSNVRDCGGWTGLDGKTIKQGLLYRGEELNQQNYGKNGNGTIDPDDAVERAKDKPYGQKITAKGIDTFVNELKIKTECDIRGYENFDWKTNINDSPTECGGLSNGNGIIKDVNYVISPVHTSRDKIYYDDYGKAAVKNFFGMLADEENYLPMYFHCAQGKDRTGFLAYLFEAFLGVSREDCMRDYLLSNLGKTGSVSESKLVGNSAQYNYVDYLDGKQVSTQGSLAVSYKATGDSMAERAYNYLLDCGLTTTQLDTIRDTFLED